MPEVNSTPPSKKSNGNGAMMGVALAIAVTIPTTINSVPDPTLRAILSFVGLIVIFVVGYRMTPRAK